jgi:neurofibromin 1
LVFWVVKPYSLERTQHFEFVSVSGLCIPSNNTIFIKSVSEKLATNEPHLTLEFLEECIQGFRVSTIELKHLCLEYMTPWLANLVRLVGVL